MNSLQNPSSQAPVPRLSLMAYRVLLWLDLKVYNLYTFSMKTSILVNLDDKLKTKIRVAAAENNVTMTALVKQVLSAYVENEVVVIKKREKMEKFLITKGLKNTLAEQFPVKREQPVEDLSWLGTETFDDASVS